MGERNMIINEIVYHKYKNDPAPMKYDDEYLNKMADFYTSENAKRIFPYIQEIPFEEWLRRCYLNKIKGDERYEYRGDISSRTKKVSEKFRNEIFFFFKQIKQEK